MSRYFIEFQSLEPYFFGNEKSFAFGTNQEKQQKAGSYFIRSEKIPSQTTIIGALRYLCLEFVQEDFDYKKPVDTNPNDGSWVKSAFTMEDINQKVVGQSSFNIISDKNQPDSFGRIQHVSPVFLFKKQETDGINTDKIFDHLLIRLPFDHQKRSQDKEEFHCYTPVSFEEKGIHTNAGCKRVPNSFNAKDGIAKGYVFVKPGKEREYPIVLDDVDLILDEKGERIRKRIFETKVKTRINTKKRQDGDDVNNLFKKEYIKLNPEYAFACFATIGDEIDTLEGYGSLKDLRGKTALVYLGQEKSLFQVKFHHLESDYYEDFKQKIEQLLTEKHPNKQVAVALSDLYVQKDLYKDLDFAITDIRDYRPFSTQYGTSFYSRFQKGEELFHLITAGSFFLLPKDKAKEANLAAAFAERIKNKYCEQMGLNTVILGGKK